MAKLNLIPAERALEILLQGIQTCGVEHVPLEQAHNRHLAQNLEALRTQPPFDASAMDGYAVRNDDIVHLPATLKIIGEAKAGLPFPLAVNPGEAVRIFTGGEVPEGADSIVIQENTEKQNEHVIVHDGVERGKFIRPAGLDFKKGDQLLDFASRLTPNRIALAASMNYAELPVFKKPNLYLFATGDELIAPGNATKPGQIIASNTYGLRASTQSWGAEVTNLGIVKDNQTTIEAAFETAISQGADIILTTGGASVGDHDLILPAGEACGFDFKITKIAMRPGKPFLYATKTIDDRTIRLIGLAGNPVSSLIASLVFLRPLIKALNGGKVEEFQWQTAELGRDLAENDERAEFMRASMHQTADGRTIATPFEKQDSSMLNLFIQADCLVYRPAAAPFTSRGNPCKIIRMDQF